MKENISIFSLYESSISIIFGLILLLTSFKFIEKVILKTSLQEIVEKKNTAMAIFTGAILYCFMSLTMVSILPSVSYLQAKIYEVPNLEFSFYIFAFLVFIIGLVICFFLTSAILFLATRVFYISTQKIDEAQEIANNNVSMAVVLAFAMIAITHYIKPSIANLMKAAVHYFS